MLSNTIESNEFNQLLERRGIQFTVLVDSYKQPFHKYDIVSEFEDISYLPPDFLIKNVKMRIEYLKKLSVQRGFKFFDDVLARLDSFDLRKDGRLALKFSKTTYFYFAALNRGLDMPVSTEANLRLRSILSEKPAELESSKLPNPLGVNVSLILEPEMKIVLAKRSMKNFEASGVMSAPIGGSLSLGFGDVESGVPDPFKTVVREAKEEIGIELDKAQVTFFGLGRDLLTLKPELLGEVRVKISEKELRKIWLKKPIDWWETQEMLFVDMKPEILIPYLGDGNWSPGGWACTLMSMLRRYPDSFDKLEPLV